ncbi:hypothetical protein [Lysobacter sp. F6437]|uniref:hypothetical protein n=1 Tax=Lysobacter sp. F6437 TaxID=3459296 RepID=UPI00403D6E18
MERMDMRRVTLPYVVLALVYGVFQIVLAGLATWAMPAGAPLDTMLRLLPSVAALPAVLLARRAGPLSYVGVALTTLGVVAVVCIAVVCIHVLLALPTGVPMDVASVAAMFGRLFVFGGWPLVLAMLMMVLAPVTWLKVLVWQRMGWFL